MNCLSGRQVGLVKRFFAIFLILSLGVGILLLSLARAAEQLALQDFNYSIGGFKDQIRIFLTFDKTAQAQLFLILAEKKMALAQELAQTGQKDLAENFAAKARGYLQKAINSKKVSPEQIKLSLTEYQQLLRQLEKPLDLF
jgi:hypothetical protein